MKKEYEGIEIQITHLSGECILDVSYQGAGDYDGQDWESD